VDAKDNTRGKEDDARSKARGKERPMVAKDNARGKSRDKECPVATKEETRGELRDAYIRARGHAGRQPGGQRLPPWPMWTTPGASPVAAPAP
jgi:hypothetical protein